MKCAHRTKSPIMNIRSKFREYGIDITTEKADTFALFLEMFVEKNKQINLSAIRDPEDIVVKHFVDTSMLTKMHHELGDMNHYLDLGTGWGFPGIPLAILYPDLHFTLLDTRKKKCLIVQEFTEQLWLGNISVAWWRAQEPGKWEYLLWKKVKLDGIVTRATSHISNLIDWSQSILTSGWKLIVYKTPSMEELHAFPKKYTKFEYKLQDQNRYIFTIEINSEKR